MMHVFYRRRRFIAAFFSIVLLTNLLQVPVSYALTSGPSQPEVQGFQPAGATDMVDLFSGDFSYNIPLFELPGPNGGYPFNLAYQSGVGMDTEASWVGLGWSLNPGAINRQMRGLPDEFDGDKIKTKMDINPNVTVGTRTGVGAEFFGGSFDFGFEMSVYQNNYRGLGYSFGSSIGFSGGGGMTKGLGLQTTLDSQEGISASPNLSLGNKLGSVGVGVGYNSNSGLSSVSISATKRPKNQYKFTGMKDGYATIKERKSISASTSISLSSPGYTPQVSMPMRNVSISATFKVGGGLWGGYAYGSASGFYNEQYLKNAAKTTSTGAYGYLNYQNASGSDMLDFNREKEGIVSQYIPNLAIPSLTYDIYSVVGQGISAMYRPMRNDIGIVYDPTTESDSWGGTAGVDVGIPGHVGVNLSVNHSRSESGLWSDDSSVDDQVGFQSKTTNSLYEPWYFKVHGEPASEPIPDTDDAAYLGGDEAVRIRLSESGKALSGLKNESGDYSTLPSAASYQRDRKTRNQVIQAYTNEQLMQGQEEVLPLFQVKYEDASGNLVKFRRDTLPDKHPAGYTALTAEGLRYNYAIPAYNLSQEEVTFSAKKASDDVNRVDVSTSGSGSPKYKYDNTDKYLKRVMMPKYAHAYLLTSIVGPDYVDVTGDGVTTDDRGYWVKFTYRKTTTAADPYQWRDPYSQAHLQEGWKTDPRDDKGSFVYGTKELWYLVKAETKSHIATFSIDARADGLGVASKLQDTDEQGDVPMYALQEAKLYARYSSGDYPIKTVKFEYDYSQCPGVYNNSEGGGKLTLKKLWFEYGQSTRGKLNPYEFSYHEDANYDYDIYAYDRWGTYKPNSASDPYYNVDCPYADQDPADKESIDAHASAWSISQIRLPSGGTILVDYETDDYAYVQHKPATYMVPLLPPDDDVTAETFTVGDGNMKLRFPLKEPISGTLKDQEQAAEVQKYLDLGDSSIYFKLKINLRGAGEGYYEYICGYADINMNEVMGLEKEDGGTDYVYGYFYVKKEKSRHPFSLRAWQHLRTNQPELASSGRDLEQTDDTDKRIDQIQSLGSAITEVKKMFTGFYDYCSNQSWGRQLVAGKSWIRLRAPDRIKYGGGLRVRQVTMQDNWSEDEEGIYGQLYDYTIVEDGDTISSGVAAYEPLAGGDENALRHAKKYVETVRLRSDNNFYFEYPINESYYPGPQVGYRKVTVMSLAAAALAGKDLKHVTLTDGASLFPKDEHGNPLEIGTSGITVNEFYTAKDFPVMTGETDKKDEPDKLAFTVPFLGSISVSNLATSQGYKVVTNDMHGKPWQVSTYRQLPDGSPRNDADTWVRYNYAHDTVVYDNEVVLKLVNTFVDNGDGTLSHTAVKNLQNPNGDPYTIGQEQEFFIDMREFDDKAWSGGAYYNVDLIYLLFGAIPIPSSWPDISNDRRQLRTAVTNKIIFKSGIQTSTEAKDGASEVITSTIKWDKQTGAPILTEVNNNYGNSLYSYTVLAHTQYAGMGAAYQNIGLSFNISNVNNLLYHDNVYEFTPSESDDLLFPGDELILYNDEEMTDPVARVIFTGEESGDKVLYSSTALTNNQDYTALIVRSGYRNQLSVSAGSVTALSDPTQSGTAVEYEKTIRVPTVN